MQNIKTITAFAKKILNTCNIDEPMQTYRDFCAYLASTINRPKTYLITHPDFYLKPAEYKKIVSAIKKLAQNKPIEQITKTAIFDNKSFFINSKVLIPRQDTEILLNEAKKQLNDLMTKPKQKKIAVADMGSGSGILAICLATYFDNLTLVGVDYSKSALKVAKKNEKNILQHSTIKWLYSNWFESFKNQFSPNSFDLIISNPPYIAKKDLARQKSTCFEPSRALFSKKNGLADFEKIIAQSKNWLKNGGFLMLEYGINQENKIINLLNKHGFKSIELIKDANQINRVVKARFFV